MTKLNIRQANINDAALIHHFITELAIYEKAEHEVKATVRDIETSMFGANSSVSALICEQAGKAIGFAVYFYNYSTWLGKNGLYLEDLYVSPKFRGCGAGKLLLKHLANIAVEQGCGRFEWSVLDWNTPSIDFYDSIGAKPKNEWIGYQLTGNDLLAFSKS
ncbi:GNAT family N-acetyltransferase [Agaribacter flavus]|uniref:GNAT family N-acetyltransferase n=1 Tax=Agaribacter flavus TaxID=1902781 RepID=A0ABV7FQ58_9ALTE